MERRNRQVEDLVAKKLFGGVYFGKTVLVTGNTGFKGTWLTMWLEKLGANVVGYSISDVTTPSHFSLLKAKHKTYLNDILNKKSLEKVFLKHKPDIVFHLAAQSLVRASYSNPSETYEVNVIGTLNVFEAARKFGSVKAIVNVTTDKVYENLELDIAYKEGDRLGGFDLYSSSKACSEILSDSYRNAFFADGKILLATARAGNVIGGGDWAKDRLIPDIVRSVGAKQPVEIRSPHSIRPWQHVLEPLSGYLLLGQKLLEKRKEYAKAWNFGPEAESCISVGQTLEKMKMHWPQFDFVIKKDKNIPHEAKILKLDFTEAKTKMKWQPIWDIDRALEKTAEWYRNFLENKKLNTEQDLADFIADAAAKRSVLRK